MREERITVFNGLKEAIEKLLELNRLVYDGPTGGMFDLGIVRRVPHDFGRLNTFFFRCGCEMTYPKWGPGGRIDAHPHCAKHGEL